MNLPVDSPHHTHNVEEDVQMENTEEVKEE